MMQLELLAADVTVGCHVRLLRRVPRLAVRQLLPGSRGTVVAIREDARGPYYVIRLDRTGKERLARREHVTLASRRDMTRARP